MKQRLDEYSNRLSILITKAKQFGCTPIIVSQPSFYYRINNENKLLGADSMVCEYEGVPINGVDFYYMIRKLYTITQTICKKNNCCFIDLADRKGWQSGDFYDFVHMTPAGAKKLGNYLFESISPIVLDQLKKQG